MSKSRKPNVNVLIERVRKLLNSIHCDESAPKLLRYAANLSGAFRFVSNHKSTLFDNDLPTALQRKCYVLFQAFTELRLPAYQIITLHDQFVELVKRIKPYVIEELLTSDRPTLEQSAWCLACGGCGVQYQHEYSKWNTYKELDGVVELVKRINTEAENRTLFNKIVKRLKEMPLPLDILAAADDQE